MTATAAEFSEFATGFWANGWWVGTIEEAIEKAERGIASGGTGAVYVTYGQTIGEKVLQATAVRSG